MQWKRNSDRNAAIVRLRSEGHSLREIVRETGASKSVVSYYFKRTPVVDSTRLAAASKSATAAAAARAASAAKLIWDERKRDVAERAKAEWPTLRKNPTFMGFLGLYWGEGNKTNNIGIVNNDPGVIVAQYVSSGVRIPRPS